MKRILFLLLFVCSFASGQIQKLEVIGLDTLTTTERNTITVPGDRVYFIYNETTGQFEYNVKGSGWTTFSGGSSGDVTAASAFGTDNALIRSDGTGKGVQSSGWTISDSGNMTAGGTGPGLNMNRLNSSTGVSISEVSSIGFSDGVSSSVMSISGEGTTNGDFEISEQGDASSSLNYVFSTNTWRIGTSPIATSTSGTAIENIVEDTTPQLGGTLDMNGQSVFGDIVPISDSAADLGSPTRAFWEANIDNLMLRPQGSSVKGWEVRSQTTGDDIVFLAETGAGTNLYTSVIYKLNDSGTPTDATDLVTKGYADANYGSGSGDVVGPASATDNAIARFDTTTGKLLQDSGVTITDAGVITAPSGFSLGSGTTTAIFAGNDLKFQRTDGFSYISQTGSNDLYFNTDNAAGTTTPIMALEGGTNTPFVKPFFSIYVNDGNGNNQGASISRNMTDYALNANAANTTSNYKGVIGVGETTSTVAAGISSFDDGTGAALGLSLFTGNNAAVAEAIRINSSQDVSIPNGDLSVTGNITVTGTVDGVDISALTGTDVALADAGAYFTTDNVEAATQELAADVAGKVDGTIPTRTSVTAVTEIGTQTMANYLSDGVPSAGQWVGISDATPEYLTTSATFNFALLDEYNYDDSATDAATITFSNMGEGHKVRIKYNRASAPTYSGETPTQLPNTFSAGSWPANDDVEAVYYKRFGTVYYFFKEL